MKRYLLLMDKGSARSISRRLLRAVSRAHLVAYNQVEGCTREQNERSVKYEQCTSHITRALSLVEPTPDQLPSTAADDALYLRSQSTSNLRWFCAPRSTRSITLDVPNYPQQAVLLGESNSSTEEQGRELQKGKNRKKAPTKKLQRVVKKEANKEPLVSELLKQCNMPSGPPKDLREEYIPLHFRIYGMDRVDREVVRVEDIDKLGAYVFDGLNKRYYHPSVHPILEEQVQEM
ncbi:hypothetical protein RMATCC62417_11547 [Rhizopus microsporus]|nr:hypothetical protein RMATCC62417_11547 [Rhizopus microsporus]